MTLGPHWSATEGAGGGGAAGWLGRAREESGRQPYWAVLAGRRALDCATRAGAPACCSASLLGWK
jgi:hypothetical protein